MEYINYLKHNFDISIIPSPHQDYNFLHKINALYSAAGRYLNTIMKMMIFLCLMNIRKMAGLGLNTKWLQYQMGNSN